MKQRVGSPSGIDLLVETTGTTFSNGKAIDQSSLNHDSTPSLTCSVCLHERPRTTHVYSRLTDHSLHHRSTKTTHRSSIASMSSTTAHHSPGIGLRVKPSCCLYSTQVYVQCTLYTPSTLHNYVYLWMENWRCRAVYARLVVLVE